MRWDALWVNVHLLSAKHRQRLAIKCLLPKERPEMPSTVPVYRASQFHERECAEMFGITFVGLPDPRNILLPDDWEGFPLRKDWEDPEFYNGMRVKPTEQMVERALGGEELGVGPFDHDPPNRHVGDEG